MMKKIVTIICMTALLAAPVAANSTIRSAYLGILLLRDNVADLFAIDDDKESIFNAGGLRSLNKKQLEELIQKLRQSVISNTVNGRTPLYDGAILAIDILTRETAALPANISYNIIFITDGFDTASKPENSLKNIETKIKAGINGKPIHSFCITVSGNASKKPALKIMETLAQGKENCWNISDEAQTQKRLVDIAQPASSETPAIVLVVDQSSSLRSEQTKIDAAVEMTIRELFKKIDNLVRIKGGKAVTGSPLTEAGRDEDEDQWQAALEDFYISPYLFTQREYEEVWGAGSNPSTVKGPNLPVTNISWYKAIETCNRLSEIKGLDPAYIIKKNGGTIVSVELDRTANGYRLPAEAEWEYSARGGTKTPYYTGNEITRQQANIKSNGPGPVGSFAPNGWSLFDMTGNVAEWCWDRYGRYPTDKGEVFEPFGEERVVRGGSYATRDDAELRAAYRAYDAPDTESPSLGFRVARNIETN